MKFGLVFFILLVLAFFSSFLAFNLLFFSGDKAFLSGFASETSRINITVARIILINFTVDVIDWGIGKVDYGSLNATLLTSVDGPENKVIGGNWSGAYGNRTSGLLLENIGNVDVVLYLKSDKNANDFLGGTDPAYQFNVTNNQTGSCENATGFLFGQYYDVNATLSTDGTRVCDRFLYNSGNHSIRIDVLLRIPKDSKLGPLADVITASAHETF